MRHRPDEGNKVLKVIWVLSRPPIARNRPLLPVELLQVLGLDIAMSHEFDPILLAICVNEGIFAGTWRPVQHQKSASVGNLNELIFFLFVDDELFHGLWCVLLYPQGPFWFPRLGGSSFTAAAARGWRYLVHCAFFRGCSRDYVTLKLVLSTAEGACG